MNEEIKWGMNTYGVPEETPFDLYRIMILCNQAIDEGECLIYNNASQKSILNNMKRVDRRINKMLLLAEKYKDT